MRIATILVATDFSAEADDALSHALGLAARTGADIVVGHVETAAEPLDLGIAPDGASLPAFEAFLADEAAESRRLLSELVARCAGRGVTVRSDVATGAPDAGIVEMAQRSAADLVVVATRGRGAVSRALLGSTAERVVRTCERSVMVTRGPAPGAGYQRILVPTDFADGGQALRAALAVAADGAHVTLFHGWQLPGGHYLPGRASDKVLAPVRASIVTGLQRRADAMIAQCPADGVTLKVELEEGAATRGIDARAADNDLIVMSSHGRRGVRRWLLGSVAETTVRHAHCSVLVIHGSAGDVAS
jgi:nucleotide-binding universal stress UspA family protein